MERAPEKKEIPEEDENGDARKVSHRPYASAYAGPPPGAMALPGTSLQSVSYLHIILMSVCIIVPNSDIGMGMGPMGLKMPAFDPSAIKSKLKSSAPPASTEKTEKPQGGSMVLPALKPTAKGLNKTMG